MEPVQNKNWNQTPDDNMKSIMLERLSIVAARGGLETEEKLKSRRNLPSCSFLCSTDPDHQLYKQKIAEYRKSPPPTPPPPAQNYVDPRFSQTSCLEQYALCSDPIAFRVRIPQGMMRKELDIIMFTAPFVVRYGHIFRCALSDRLSTETQFKFLDQRDTDDIKFYFFSRLLNGYQHLITSLGYPPGGVEAVLEVFSTAFNAIKKKQEDEGEDEVVDKVETNMHDFVVCDEYFAAIENKDLLNTPPLSTILAFRVGIPQGGMMQPSTILAFRVGIPQGGMMRKELGIIKFTAQFVVRFGNDFWDSLWNRVSTEAEFQFLKRNPGNDTLFSQLLLAYGNVIQPWGIRPRKFNNPARMEAVLEGFFSVFHAFKGQQEKEGDEVVDKVLTDRLDFVVSNEHFQSFLDIEERTPRPVKLWPRQMGSQFARPPPPPMVMMMQPPPLHEKPEPKRMMQPPPLHEEEPDPKRGKLDESALVSEEEFLAQRPGSSTITINVTTRRAIQITVESLSENVASLKEKIAGKMGIPANQQKLIGKTGVLKDDMSLAHYNLGVEEMLTLAD